MVLNVQLALLLATFPVVGRLLWHGPNFGGQWRSGWSKYQATPKFSIRRHSAQRKVARRPRRRGCSVSLPVTDVTGDRGRNFLSYVSRRPRRTEPQCAISGASHTSRSSRRPDFIEPFAARLTRWAKAKKGLSESDRPGRRRFTKRGIRSPTERLT